MKVTIKPVRPCSNEPLFIKCDDIDINVTCAVDEKGNSFPAQKTDGGVIVILTSDSTEEVTLTLSSEVYEKTISFEEENEKLNIFYNGKLFSSYQYLSEIKKPFFGPVITKTGNTFTRPDLHHIEHPHQRSVFVGIGDVNGVDLWNEPENSGYLQKGKPKSFVNGSAFSSFEADNIWLDKDENKLLNETRKFTMYNQSEDCRYVDIEITFKADYCDINFGNTKEAGPLGVRVNENIDVDHGGYLKNSYGGFGESECWSKSAQWCLYGGKLDGEDVAIAVFDNENNERYPTCWHIRNYGLFAANNLFFRGGISLKKNESITYKFRLCFFNNTAEDVSDRFLIYNLNK